MKFEIYTDGSTRNNGRANAVGAWGYTAISEGKIIHENCRVEKGATNQQMELKAAAEALEYLFSNEICVPFDHVIVYTDSAYLHNCYMQKWYRTWENNGWRNSKKEPVANRELWERLIRFFEAPEVEFVKVKGHANNSTVHEVWNDHVDKMVQNATLALGGNQ